MKKIFTTLNLTLITLSMMSISPLTFADTISDNTSHSSITPYADIIEWRIKVINGKVYKRQYNYSKGVWIGNWVLV